MPLLYADFARPAPPPEIVKRLKQIDERLDLMYVAWPHQDGANVNVAQNWAIIQRWRQNDKRRVMIQLQQMAETSDFDVMVYLPIDCPVEEAFGLFERSLKGKFGGNEDVQYFLNNLHKWNKEQAKENLKIVTEHAEELIEANVGTLFEKQGKTIPKVYMSEGHLKK